MQRICASFVRLAECRCKFAAVSEGSRPWPETAVARYLPVQDQWTRPRLQVSFPTFISRERPAPNFAPVFAVVCPLTESVLVDFHSSIQGLY